MKRAVECAAEWVAKRVAWAVLVGSLAASGSATAEDRGIAPAREEEWALTLAEGMPAAERPFDAGSWVLQGTVSYVNGDAGFFGDTVEAGMGNLGVGYYFKDDWGVYAEVMGVHWDQHDTDLDVAGVGLNLLLRWHFLNRENYSLFIDGGGGLVRFEDEFPAGGTHSNFTARVGLGGTYRIADNLHLIAALRYYHLSNAARHGQDENPSLDGVEASVGVMWEF